MDSLISEYSSGGSKIGIGANQRLIPVTFIFMTGHAEANSNVGSSQPKNQADLIINHCTQHNYYCLDYYSIDTHDMTGNYWEDASDDGSSSTGGNFYTTWQSTHALNTDFYYNRSDPGGSVTYGEHNTQHITANRKAFAMWWILARIAGWDGNLVPTSTSDFSSPINNKINLFPNPSNGNFNISINQAKNENVKVKIYNTSGQNIKETNFSPVSQSVRQITLDLTGLPEGIYMCEIIAGNQQLIQKIQIIK